MVQFILGVIVGAVVVLIWQRRASVNNPKRSLAGIGSLSDNPELVPVITMIVDQRIETKLREVAEYRNRTNTHTATLEMLAKALE